MKLCSIPWVGFSNDPDGKVKPCCIYKEHIVKPNGEPYYIQVDTVKDIFHSEYMENLRKDFLSGKQPEPCSTCWKDEENGYKSKRQIYNDIYENKMYGLDYQNVPEYPEDYQLIISNACNLKCRSCTPSHSNTWQKEMVTILQTNEDTPEFRSKYGIHTYELAHGQPGSNSSILVKDIDNWIPNIKRLEIVGGEPFYIGKWGELWDYMIDKGYSKNIELYLSTNTTIFDEKMVTKLIKNFKNVGIGLSIDGLGKTYNYLRHPGKWEVTSENIMKYYEIYQKYKKDYKIGFSYTHTISWVNAIFVPDFHEWVSKNTPEFRIWDNIVHYPLHLTITMIPEQYKNVIKEKWSRYDFGKYQNDVNAIMNFMMSRNHTEDEIRSNYKKITFFDAVRNESIKEVLGDYYIYIKDYFE